MKQLYYMPHLSFSLGERKPRHYPIFTYKGEPIQGAQNFKYLVMSHRQLGGMCAMSVDLKRVGIAIICLKIDSSKVVLEDGT